MLKNQNKKWTIEHKKELLQCVTWVEGEVDARLMIEQIGRTPSAILTKCRELNKVLGEKDDTKLKKVILILNYLIRLEKGDTQLFLKNKILKLKKEEKHLKQINKNNKQLIETKRCERLILEKKI